MIKKLKTKIINDFRRITITYNFETDETKIKLSDSFNNLPKIHQLDALQDALAELTLIYNKKLSELHDGKIEGDSFYKNNKND